jgi:mono/diheme cytochrome c family protein
VGDVEKKKMAAKLDDPTKVWTLDDIMKRGEKVYAANCAACHQASGKGAGPIKPLDGAAVVLDADHAKEIQVLLKGQNNGAMPSWKQLSDTDIAAVIDLHQEHLVQQDRPARAAGRSAGPARQVSRRRNGKIQGIQDECSPRPSRPRP